MIGAPCPLLARFAGSTQSLGRSLSQIHPISARCSPCTRRGLLVSPYPLLHLPTDQFSPRFWHRKLQKPIQYPRTRSGFVQ
jgi:hypothetical protein